MPSDSRNVRSRTPRPLGVRRTVPEPLRHAHRFGAPVTPTPPPVVVTSALPLVADPGELPAPVQEPRVRIGGWTLAALLVLACLVTAVAWRTLEVHHGWFAKTGATDAAAAVIAPTAAPSAETSAPPGGWTIKHDGYDPVPGGVFFVPPAFSAAADGSYDLVVHFHGNPKIVRASVEHARLNAALAIINVGIRSGPYRERYQVPGAFEELIAQAEASLQKRGVRSPKLRRLALTSWSAGYGAIESILEHRRVAEPDPLDAILALDGVHASYVDGDEGRISEPSIRAFVRAARAAAEGQLMVLLTHSEIPTPGFASARRTQQIILERVGVTSREMPMLEMPPRVDLPEARGAAEKDERMVPIFDLRAGMLRVRGFEGITRSHHAAHLTQMSPVALADLATRWAGPPAEATAD
jgi:hypothetical protein